MKCPSCGKETDENVPYCRFCGVGKGVSFMEGAVEYHAKTLTDQECERALQELS